MGCFTNPSLRIVLLSLFWYSSTSSFIRRLIENCTAEHPKRERENSLSMQDVIEMKFDFDRRLARVRNARHIPLLFLESRSMRLSVHLNSEHELKIMHYHHDLDFGPDGYWSQLFSSKECIVQDNSDLYCIQQNIMPTIGDIMRYSITLRNNDHIAVSFNGLTLIEQIDREIFASDKEIHVWVDPGEPQGQAVRKLKIRSYKK